jgi:hypothetical protein
MMRPMFQSVLAAAFLAMASVAVAGPFEDGQAACQRQGYGHEVVPDGRGPGAC